MKCACQSSFAYAGINLMACLIAHADVIGGLVLSRDLMACLIAHADEFGELMLSRGLMACLIAHADLRVAIQLST